MGQGVHPDVVVGDVHTHSLLAWGDYEKCDLIILSLLDK